MGVDRPRPLVGKGPARALEAAMRDPGLDLRAHRRQLLAAENARPASSTRRSGRRGRSDVAALEAGPRRAKRCLVEVPFVLPVDRRDVGLWKVLDTVL